MTEECLLKNDFLNNIAMQASPSLSDEIFTKEKAFTELLTADLEKSYKELSELAILEEGLVQTAIAKKLCQCVDCNKERDN